MRFAVFADQLSGIHLKVYRRAEEVFELLTPSSALRIELALDQSLKKSAARFAISSCLSIESFEQAVGNGNHHLCHEASIYGIAESCCRHPLTLADRNSRMGYICA